MKKILTYFVTICIILSILIILWKLLEIDKKILKKSYPDTYKEIVDKYSKEYQIDKNIIFAIIKCESDFNAEIVSPKGAQGLMQIMEETAKDVYKLEYSDASPKNTDISNINLQNPEINIKIGTSYFAYLIKKYKNIALALAAYNARSTEM